MARIEKDSLGSREVPEEAYYGIFTTRAMENFQISGQRVHPELTRSIALIKKAAAKTNADLKLLDAALAKAIIAAADEVLAGKHEKEFPLDIFQAGAGTPANMNVNEVLANRANELLGGKKGAYDKVHPNNHVNMGQSSNDVIPTAMRIACCLRSRALLAELDALIVSFRRKGKEFDGVLKAGRTHLEDAVPIRLGQEFEAFAVSLQKSRARILESLGSLRELGIGGTAIGTGITTVPQFRQRLVKELATLAKEPLVPTKNLIETTSSMGAFLHYSSALRYLAVELTKVSNDLRLLNSGPKTGIAEITLPDVEPGSSIMPGKVNPSIPECMNLICFQVMGADHVVELAAQAGQLQLNVMTPVMAFNLLFAADILSSGMQMLRVFCVEGIRAEKERCSALLEESFCMATALNPYAGYEVVAELVKRGLKSGKSIIQVIREEDVIEQKDLERVLSAELMTAPQELDMALRERIQKNPRFLAFRERVRKAV
ncbi:aspartate ammonia-lyase [Candidatus Woesearchaeota archaeon]|nr:aspartate ammonia-lyase [Candidatus Woesearchaeota archaeon]